MFQNYLFPMLKEYKLGVYFRFGVVNYCLKAFFLFGSFPNNNAL